MDNGNKKKLEQLGMPIGTASARLRKMIMFDLLQKFDLARCVRCQQEIETIEELSIEHVEPWLDSSDPISKFFDLNNIAFSHIKCNVGKARKNKGPRVGHGHSATYNRGCRCDICKEHNRILDQKLNQKRREVYEQNMKDTTNRKEYNEYMKQYMRKYRSKVA